MNRRELVRNALLSAAAFSLPLSVMRPAAGGPSPIASEPPAQSLIRIVKRTIEVKGRDANVFGLMQSNGKPGLSIPAGGDFNVLLRNETVEPTIIHWHGLTPPWEQDGVPNAPLPLIEAKADRAYRFPVGATGTHWMHAHTLQEQNLLAAPLIVTDATEQGRDEQSVVILLHDFSFLPPEELLARLKGGAGHGSMGGMDHSSMGRAMAPQRGSGSATAEMDLNDIDYDAYLANDRTLDDPEVVRVELGGKVRLRIINGATATAFTIDVGDVDGTLVAVDGQNIEPLKGRRFPISMGQRLDIQIRLPQQNRAFPILALREGAPERTGIILAPAKASISKLASVGERAGPVLDLKLEQTLRAARPLTQRKPDKTFNMDLVGGMHGYEWGLNTTPPLVARKNHRVEVTMFNVSMMAHPMHLHGHHFQVVAIDGRRLAGAVRDTIYVPAQRSVTIAFDAANPGQWAFHCHHLYHMATGMMSTLNYEG